mmetsp:Transcript_21233/g.20907  ORF Transcript_21233/g.20907 Transcript_21233/m.20907 type:complete len:107 (+) Transcript_21233:95-415(+)
MKHTSSVSFSSTASSFNPRYSKLTVCISTTKRKVRRQGRRRQQCSTSFTTKGVCNEENESQRVTIRRLRSRKTPLSLTQIKFDFDKSPSVNRSLHGSFTNKEDTAF